MKQIPSLLLAILSGTSSLIADQSTPNYCAWAGCRVQVEPPDRFCYLHRTNHSQQGGNHVDAKYGNVTPYTDDSGYCAMVSSIDGPAEVEYTIVSKRTDYRKSFNIRLASKGSHSTAYKAADYTLIVDSVR